MRWVVQTGKCVRRSHNGALIVRQIRDIVSACWSTAVEQRGCQWSSSAATRASNCSSQWPDDDDDDDEA